MIKNCVSLSSCRRTELRSQELNKRSYLNNGVACVFESVYITESPMKRSFFQAAVTSILLYGCTTWTLTKRLEKKLDGNYTRMLRAILNKSWQQHPTRHQLYGHLPPITKTIQVRRTRHAGHCWRSRDELIRDVLLWIPTHGRAKAGRPARTYIQQLCEDTGCCPEDLPRAMNDREEWRERVRDIRATSAIWWWWLYYGYVTSVLEKSLHVSQLPLPGFVVGLQFIRRVLVRNSPAKSILLQVKNRLN